MKKFSIAVASILAMATAAYVAIYSLPFLGIDWVPRFGPVPCPTVPIFDTAAEKWKDPSFRREIIAETGGGSVKFDNENLFGNEHLDFDFGVIIKHEMVVSFGEYPSREEFHEGMKMFGLRCSGEKLSAASNDVPYASAQIDCTRNVPRGCPSHFGHWPLLFPSSQLSATATFKSKDPHAIYTSYTLAQASAF